MKLTHLYSSLILMLMLATGSHGQGASAAVTTTFSNMEGVDGEKSSVVYSNRSGNPILRNSGFIAIGTFNLERAQIAALATASDLNDAFYQFGESSSFNSTENGAFQANASGDPAEAYDGGDTFDGAAVYLVIGDGSDLATSSEFLVWKSDQVFDGSGPIGGPSELILSVDSGDLIIGLKDKNTSDFSAIGGDVVRAAFTTVMIDSGIDDHGDSTATATFVAANSTTSGNLKDGDDADYFRVDLSEDGNLSLSVAGGSNIVLSIYDEQGGELVTSSVPDQSVASDLASGTYYVRVVGDLNTSDDDYSLESDFLEKIIDLDPESAGSYYGLVVNAEDEFVGHLAITISDEGYYSGLLRGVSGFERSFKGAIQPDYSDTTLTENVSGEASSIYLTLSKNSWGTYQLLGGFKLLGGTEYIHDFSLNYAPYSKSEPVPKRLSGRYTLHMPYVSSSENIALAGNGFAAGTMWSGGWLNLYGRSNSGAKFTHSSRLLAGKNVPFYASPNPEAGLETIMGTLWFRNRTTTDMHGSLRYYRKASVGGYYNEGFDESLNLEGSKYVKPSLQELAANNYPLGNVSKVATLYGGDFDGLSNPVTFIYNDGDLKNRMRAAQTTNITVSGSITHKAGWLWGVMKTNTVGDDGSDIRIDLRGVLLQKLGLISGQAETVNNSLSRFSVLPAK